MSLTAIVFAPGVQAKGAADFPSEQNSANDATRDRLFVIDYMAQLIGYPPDRSVGVLRHEERAVMGDRNSNRPSPNFRSRWRQIR